ncbi:hypothetical protein MF271_03770 [Deinococcus sp. KNUC1210]|uniref:hypothetical protein n=1 Tax=Deinococcus sp. KNUC1210 TaxID=2917691 RepID=UPI001EF009C0|nr:hypothetical protein [Deinococcus sp. KNUC1210]ULH15766.1 hypothetical protein MF271_03770 [Deinococcus sp. KNUC1210]
MRPSFLAAVLPMTGLLWLARPARRLPPDTLTSEADGLGPVTERWYWLDVRAADRSPEDLVKAVLDDFPRIMPPVISWTRKVQGTPGLGSVGDRYFFLLIARRAWVQTDLRTPRLFRNRTLRHHPESGWVAFSAEPQESGVLRLMVHSRVRASTRLDRLTYLLGMREVQRLTWEIVLRRALALSGGQQVDHGHHTVEYAYAPDEVSGRQTARPAIMSPA